MKWIEINIDEDSRLLPYASKYDNYGTKYYMPDDIFDEYIEHQKKDKEWCDYLITLVKQVDCG